MVSAYGILKSVSDERHEWIDLPVDVREAMVFHPVSTLDEVFAITLLPETVGAGAGAGAAGRASSSPRTERGAYLKCRRELRLPSVRAIGAWWHCAGD